MAENDVTIQINLDAKDAQAAIELFGRESVKVLKKTEDQSSNFFNVFKSGALKLTGAFVAITGGFQAIRNGINEAAEDAKLTRQIEASLRSVGDASSQAVNSVLDFADAIKSSTGVSDDLVKQTFIIAQSFGISTDKAKELTKAAIDLAAATGQDVESAVRLLGGTLDGSIGKLGNYGAEFRNLTKQQLEAGAAIDLVNQKFGGTAIKDLDTYSGRLGQLTNSFSDLLKELGKTITESPTLQALFKLTSFAIDNVTQSVKKQREESEKSYATDGLAIAYFGAYSGLAQAAASAQNDLNKEIEAFRDINVGDQSKKVADGFAGIVEQSQGATKATSNFLERLNSIPQSKAPQAIGLTGKALEDATKKANEAAKAFAAFQSSIAQERGTEQEKIVQKATEDLKKLGEFEKQFGKQNALEIQRLKIQISQSTNEQLIKLEQEASKKEYEAKLADAKRLNDDLRDLQKKRLEDFQAGFANPVQSSLGSLFSGESVSFEKAAGAVGGVLNQALQGKEGAKQFASQLTGFVADFFLPGIGGIVSQIASILAQGPEKVKELIKEFIKYVPEFITAIAESIPVVVDTLIDYLLFEGGLEKIVGAILRAIPKIAIGLAVAFRDAIVDGAKAIGDALAKFFSKAIGNFLKPITDLFDGLKKALENVTGFIEKLFEPIERLIRALTGRAGKGGGKGLIAETFGAIGDAIDRAGGKGFTEGLAQTEEDLRAIFGFAKGGLVPQYAADGFFKPMGTDTVPAMLTPGELVVPRDMVGELGAFLMRQNSDAPSSDSAMLASILSTVQSPIVVRTEAKVNQQAFADIILQLNRQNARLSA
ncbi:hypothetical protein EB118_06750 [bacterium]|nr:hypothetical protein [bacterium]NDG29778.1 hypothetical protein [bacterium]